MQLQYYLPSLTAIHFAMKLQMAVLLMMIISIQGLYNSGKSLEYEGSNSSGSVIIDNY
jgi:hypothetical protein